VAWQFPLDHGLFLDSAAALVRTARGSAAIYVGGNEQVASPPSHPNEHVAMEDS
jgi:hypothetical protein